jgi:hypothetical protein
MGVTYASPEPHKAIFLKKFTMRWEQEGLDDWWGHGDLLRLGKISTFCESLQVANGVLELCPDIFEVAHGLVNLLECML